jgi:ATP-binding cassette, subfamily C, bacteriocin exporter
VSKYPFIKQENIKDCGVTSLLMIIKYYKGYENIEYLRYISNTDKKGVTAYDLIKTAIKVGFEAEGIKCDKDSYDKLNLPCIAHVVLNNTYKHYVVIYQIDFKNNKILIADPITKLKWITFEYFNQISTNVFILLTNKKQLKNNKNSIVDFIMDIVSLNKKTIIYIVIFSLLITIFSIIYSFHFQFLIKANNINNIVILSYIFLNIFFIKIYSDFFRNKILIKFTKMIDEYITSKEYKKMLNLPYKYFTNQTTGEIVSKLNDLETIKDVVSKVLITVFIDFLFSLLIIIVMMLINYKLTFITIICASIYMILSIVYSKRFTNNIYDLYDQKVNYNSFLVESVSNFETIKGLSIESDIYNKFIFKHKQYLNTNAKFKTLYNKYYFIKESIYNLCLVIILAIAINDYNDNLITIGSIITFNFLFFNFITPLKDLFEIFIGIKEGNILLNRMFLNIDKEYKLNKKIKGDIKINNLTYSYKDNINIINNFSMIIKSGQKVLITGDSGCGKSTILKCIKKYTDVNSNMILLDNIDINNYDKNTIDNIMYLSQNENLFTDSVLNNISLYKESKDISNIIDICKIENDLNLIIEENGKNISGGQRQRIILARTMLKKGYIYLLDEPFSQLDI